MNSLVRASLALALIVTAAHAQIPIQNNARIFFVGNSYVGTSGGLNEYVKRALAAGTPSLSVTCDASISWAKDVDYMYDSSTAPQTIRTGNWDVVVLQGFWSGIDYPSGTLAMLQRYAAKFDSLSRAHGATFVLMMPWTGNPLASWMGAPKFHSDMVAFQTNYTALGATLNAPVAPCSHAWHSLTDTLPRAGLPRDYLYGDDLHQNNLSSYLNSWIFYAILTHRSPVGLNYTYTSVTNVTYDDALRTAMQQRAWTIAQLYLPTTATRRSHAPLNVAPVSQSTRSGRVFDIRGRVIGRGERIAISNRTMVVLNRY